jgi:hypothetical protein
MMRISLATLRLKPPSGDVSRQLFQHGGEFGQISHKPKLKWQCLQRKAYQRPCHRFKAVA